MTVSDFLNSIKDNEFPGNEKSLIKALWYDAKENWGEAHKIAQSDYSAKGAWLHAYLHRKEGDLINAEYWYSKARKEVPSVSLEDEWMSMVNAFLDK